MKLKSAVRVLIATAVMFVAVSSQAEYRFKVHNNTNLAIKKILVSEDGEEFGFFDIGKGIKSGATVDLVWDDSTDGESCEQYFKAVWENGQESEPIAFDFCEEGLTLEFHID